ncbi:hypothetical protein Bbelb_154120, partial [Branchiostoma belcheri]
SHTATVYCRTNAECSSVAGTYCITTWHTDNEQLKYGFCGTGRSSPVSYPYPNPAPAPQPSPVPAPYPYPAPAPYPYPSPVPAPVPAPAPYPYPYPSPAPAPSPVPAPYPYPSPYPAPYPYPYPSPAPSPVPAPAPSRCYSDSDCSSGMYCSTADGGVCYPMLAPISVPVASPASNLNSLLMFCSSDAGCGAGYRCEKPAGLSYGYCVGSTDYSYYKSGKAELPEKQLAEDNKEETAEQIKLDKKEE